MSTHLKIFLENNVTQGRPYKRKAVQHVLKPEISGFLYLCRQPELTLMNKQNRLWNSFCIYCIHVRGKARIILLNAVKPFFFFASSANHLLKKALKSQRQTVEKIKTRTDN